MPRRLVVLGEDPAPQVIDAETEYDHLEGISLLSAGLTPGYAQAMYLLQQCADNLATQIFGSFVRTRRID